MNSLKSYLTIAVSIVLFAAIETGYGDSGYGIYSGGPVDDLLGGLTKYVENNGCLNVSSTNGRSKTSIARGIASNLAAIRYHYMRRLREKPDMAGKITVKFTIDEYGKVLSAQIIESTVDDVDLEQTVLFRVKSWNLGYIDRPGDVSEAAYTFIFEDTLSKIKE
jgi:TonB family protein